MMFDNSPKILFERLFAQKIPPYFYSVASFLLIGIFYLTSNSYDYEFSIDHGFSDISSYFSIASAENLTSLHPLSNHYPFHHLERWAPHLLIKFFSKFIPLELWHFYEVINLICVCVAAYLVGTLKCNPLNKLAYFSLLLFNPYTFRYYVGVPGMISDAIFFLALIAFCISIFNKRFVWLYLATFVACLTRQTGILLLPILLLTYYTDKANIRPFLIAGLSGLSGVLVSKIGASFLFAPPNESYLLDHILGIFFWLGDNPNFYDLFNFFGRYVLMLFSISPMLLLIKKQKISSQGICGIFFFLIIQTQPILGGPGITDLNIDRLAILGLPFLGLLFFNANISATTFLFFEILMLLCSLNPFFSSLHLLSPFNRYLFVVLLVFIFCICVFFFFAGNGRQLKFKNLPWRSES